MGRASNRKWAKRAKWKLSRGARLRKMLPVHQKQIGGLIDDLVRAHAMAAVERDEAQIVGSAV